jgi:UDP-N-acetylmuramoyl-L-alanyl-D-glutamate--2,6-diaminopimelate ligase
MEVFSSYKHLFFLLKKKIRTYTPQPLLTVYLAAYPFIGNYVYGKPSRKMRIIGITGTDGKSSTVIFAAKLLRAAGYKVGYFSSVSYSEGDEDKVNGFKMTMPGRFFL